jgi:protein associated with RNAse G/E
VDGADAQPDCAACESSGVEYAIEKWGGHPHYSGLVHHLGDDEHGSWFWGPSGRTIYRGSEPRFVTEQDALILIIPGAWWTPAWWFGHPDVDLYVNINTPAVWHGDRIVSVDVDLDVIRFGDGRVEIVDRDEFEAHQHSYGYPGDVIEAAERAADAALALVERNDPPFDGEAAHSRAERARSERSPATGSHGPGDHKP